MATNQNPVDDGRVIEFTPEPDSENPVDDGRVIEFTPEADS